MKYTNENKKDLLDGLALLVAIPVVGFILWSFKTLLIE